MPKLVKLEGNGDVSNYTPPEGHVTTFLAWNNGNVQLRLKNSAGQIATFEKQAVPVSVQPYPEVSIDLDKMTITASYTPVAGKVEDTTVRTRVIPLQRASTEPPQIAVGTDGKITAHYFLVGGGTIKETVQPKAELQLPVIEGQEITPGIEEKSLAAGSFLTGDVTIAGDENLIPENIKKGTSIFGVTGSLTGGGGAFDLVKVTEYQPYQAAFSGVSKVTLSGFGVDDMSGNDYSYLNGDWAVENPNEPDPLKRSFVNGSNFLYYFPDPEYRVGGDAWCIGSNKNYGGHEATLYYNSTSELSNGTVSWSSMMGGATTQCTVTKSSYPEAQSVLKGQKATAYDPVIKVWTFADEVSNFTETEKVVIVNGVYAATGSTLIGSRIAYGGGLPVDGLLLHIPFATKNGTAETGQTLEYSGSQSFTTLDGVPCMKITSGYVKTASNSGISGSTSRTFSFWACPTSSGTYVNALGCGNESSHGRMFNCGIRLDGSNYRPQFTTWGNDWDGNPIPADGKLHHLVYVFNQSAPNLVKIYVDGSLFENKSVDGINTVDSPFWMGQSGAGGWEFTGHLASVRCYNRALTEDEIVALATEHE